MANRKTCLICRGFTWGARRDILWLPLHRVLCPEHKRLRNRLQRSKAAAVRAAGEGDTPT